ncbi:MAG: hypothetical protein EBZ74_05585 [Planctomycetia bacterium]|nr:hypothetical protein [Planctomycetia bacterium]
MRRSHLTTQGAAAQIKDSGGPPPNSSDRPVGSKTRPIYAPLAKHYFVAKHFPCNRRPAHIHSNHLKVYALRYRDTKAALRHLTEVATSQGGYFTARQAESAGYAASHLSYHIRAGNFERAGHGLYRIPTLPLSDHDDLVRLWLWSRGRDDRPQAVISHQTALALHDLAELIPTTIHLTVPPGFRKRRPRACLLHKGIVEPAATQPFDAIAVTTPLKTLRDLASDHSMPTEQFRNAVSTAVKRGLITRREADHLLAHRRDSAGASGSKGT